jgi:DNA polymerase
VQIELSREDDFEEWKDRARQLVRARLAPDQVVWSAGGATADLFRDEATASGPDQGVSVPESDVRVSKRFMALAGNAILHSDPDRFSLLYRLLWRHQNNSKLMQDTADPDVARLEALDRAVRRDSHKMHAFVRFRRLAEPETGEDHYVAWFEPDHHIVRANAGFFMRRFTNMKWSILTPRGCLHWDGAVMREGPPASRGDAPAGDPVEDLWRTYYSSIFNPARLKIGAMLKEMPKRYWKNMPEAALIPEMVAGAQAREAAMVTTGTLEFDERPDTLDGIGAAIQRCRKCPIGELDGQAVMGEGPRSRAEGFSGLMIIGEQPGDREEETGKPFIGPAGQLLDVHLQKAGIERKRAYVTNAVKHFKYVRRGKRRIHQSPAAREIDTCRWWLEGERELLEPRIILATGASAARAVLGKTVSISKVRGNPIELEDSAELWVTAHPSYLLRLEGEAREQQEKLFEADLAAVAERLAEITG